MTARLGLHVLLGSLSGSNVAHDQQIQLRLSGADGKFLASVLQLSISFRSDTQTFFLCPAGRGRIVVINTGVGRGQSTEDGLVEAKIVAEREI